MARGARLLLVVALLAALLAVVLQLYRLRKPRLWTGEELSVYNGTDERLPILLGILGSVFDVTKGRSHYGPGGGYHHFAGRDASRAFVSGNFTGKFVLLLVSSVNNLDEQVNVVCVELMISPIYSFQLYAVH